jgi:hypothetical protein
LEVVAEEERRRWMAEGFGEEGVVTAEETYTVQGRAREVVGDFFA